MSELKYKVGDKVRIKSIDWYNRHAKETEDNWKYFPFSCDMKKYCGQIMTISIVRGCSYSMIEDDYRYAWTDEMIEGIVERNGKTYPYKIGDRVLLKGNNRCATITDLKYNSWGNLSYYIKIDNDKDISIDYPTDLLLPYDNKVEGLVEEETEFGTASNPIEIKSNANCLIQERVDELIKPPKFKVGDKITNGKVTLTILTLSFDRYVVKDNFGKCGTLYFNTQDDWKIVEEESKPKNEDEKNGESKPKNEDEVNGEYYSTPKYLIRPSGYQFVDENGNVINAMKIVLEKKKKEYPKTYEECCDVLNIETNRIIEYDECLGYRDITQYDTNLLTQLKYLRKLRICRDAYWKIAGDEMGLRKPWEPDYNKEKQLKYGLYEILKYSLINPSQFVFPTEEMRDMFYENFKKEIEFVKELL